MPTWIRVKDRDTGHEYDLHEDDPRLAGDVVEILTDYPANSSSTAQARPPKHRVNKAGKPVAPAAGADREPPTDDPPADDRADEKTTAGTSAKTKRSN